MKKIRFASLFLALGFMLASGAWWVQRSGAQVVGQDAGTRVEPQAITVRVLFGKKDTVPTNWDGSFSIVNGTFIGSQGWNFRSTDKWISPTSWVASTRISPVTRKMNTNGVLITLKASSQTQIQITTAQGNFSFAPAALVFGQPVLLLNGAASAERVFSEFTLPAGNTEDDFPTAAADTTGTLWTAYVSYTYGQSNLPFLRPMLTEPQSFDFLRPQGNGDQIRLARLTAQGGAGQWSHMADLTPAGQDVYRPALATGLDGEVWVAWSQKVGGQWDVYARRYNNGALSPPIQITQDASPDLHVALARDASGNIWLAWQSFANGTSDILISSVARGTENWNGATPISTSSANDWDPQLACGNDGSVWAVWDTYDKGDYDVMLRRLDGAEFGPAINVSDSPKFEARASVVCDAANRVWIAWEEAGPLWGKDYGRLYRDPAVGIPLYSGHTINVRCYADGQRLKTAGTLATLNTGTQTAFPRLGTDDKGRVFLTCRRPISDVQETVSTSWHSVVTFYEGSSWAPVVTVPNSDNALDARPAFANGPGGALYLVHTSDGRNQTYSTPWRNQIYIAPITGMAGSGPAVAPALVADPATMHDVDAKTLAERNDVSRLRSYRARAGPDVYQIVRGEFHRHTEISGDGKSEGSLIDMWRYGLDAATLDWIGNGDHNSGSAPGSSGGDREYTWWLVQKHTDAFTVPSQFAPVFSYERSVSFPDGHRNIIFPERGIRPLPRLKGNQANGVSPNDTKMLYKYLRAFDGICAAHTSGQYVGGTDWRDNDREVEPIVEIYQGDRQSYEYEGAPRSATAADAIGGYNPAGYVWNALAKGYRLGFESSSDHRSTHISYTMAYASTPTPQGVVDALRRRHCYAATDNILLDVRCGNKIMGDEFTIQTLPSLQISVTGTGPIARVIVVKNNKIVYTAMPNTTQVDLSWTDVEGCQGMSYYYVRIEQADGQLAWSSPMWIHGA